MGFTTRNSLAMSLTVIVISQPLTSTRTHGRVALGGILQLMNAGGPSASMSVHLVRSLSCHARQHFTVRAEAGASRGILDYGPEQGS